MNPRLLVIGHAPVLRINRPAYRHLAAMGWDVRLVLPADTRPFGVEAPEEEPDPRLPLVRVPFDGASVRTWTLQGIESMIRDFRPDVVFMDGEPDGKAAVQLARARSVTPFFFTILTCENFFYPVWQSLLAGQFRRAARDVLLRGLLRKSRAAIGHMFVLGQDSVKVMEQMGFAGRISVVPLGYDETMFRPEVERRAIWREKLGINGLVVGYFGRLIEQKGIHLLLQALHDNRDVPCTLVMDEFQVSGDYQRRIEALIRTLDLESQVKFVHVSHEQMPGCLNAIDIVVIPSLVERYWKEQYGRISQEAMASGCAVLATRSGTLPELTGDTALLVEPGNQEQLSAALRRLMEEPTLRHEFAQRAQARATERLTSFRQAQIMNDIFRKNIAIA